MRSERPKGAESEQNLVESQTTYGKKKKRFQSTISEGISRYKKNPGDLPIHCYPSSQFGAFAFVVGGDALSFQGKNQQSVIQII